MNQTKLARQMIEFYKATFDNSFNALTILQEQTEKMAGLFLDQSPWIPREGKDTVKEWIATYKRGRDIFKQNVDESYGKVKEYFATAGRTEDT
ncbi:MAG: hypothetical protein M0Q23_07840 [Syntrophales bacterium]|jgi:hypothetical protein|nr:hypothetical protein [Syntrophales bacterium]MCK9528535.1 hypothetical protein [Syntrophales bacterium]MDX9922838.1 hypothetical protein [Syntrophales bacterium]